MPVDIRGLCADLAAERAEVDLLLAPLDDAGWSAATPAERWDVRDQITHLAYFDDACRLSIEDAATFVADRQDALSDMDTFADRVTARHHDMSGSVARRWLLDATANLVAAAVEAPAGLRVPWYGPDMSVASSLSARLMETWAHGQDVADAVGVTRRPSDRIRHVAFLGVNAFANSFRANGIPVPDVPVRVTLTGPHGDTWTFGPDDAPEVVTGPALDFCLVVTQRRHRADTALVATGPTADRWLDIAQAFAGPPGTGRPAEAHR